MIRFRGLPVLLAAGLLLAVQPSSAEIKIGYIDSEILRERMPEFKDIQRQLDRLTQTYEQEAIDRRSKLLKMEEDFRKQELLMSEARKAEIRAEFDQAMQDLQQYTQEKLGNPGGEVWQKNIELSAPIFERVNEALKRLAVDEGYDFILDSAAGGIVYADPERYNLTEKLLTLLEEEREEESSP